MHHFRSALFFGENDATHDSQQDSFMKKSNYLFFALFLSENASLLLVYRSHADHILNRQVLLQLGNF